MLSKSSTIMCADMSENVDGDETRSNSEHRRKMTGEGKIKMQMRQETASGEVSHLRECMLDTRWFGLVMVAGHLRFWR